LKITYKEFANILSVSPQSIHNSTRRGKLIKDSDGLYNTDNEINKAYLLDRGVTVNDFSKKNVESITPDVNSSLVQEEKREENQFKSDDDLKNAVKIENSLRHGLQLAIKNDQKSGKIIDLLGCDIAFLKSYLKIEDGYDGNKFHIDHIIPCASYDLSKESEQYKCFNYKNLRLISKFDNLSKGKSVDFDEIKKNNIKDLLPTIKKIDIVSNSGDFEKLSGLPATMMNMSLKELVMKYGGSMSLEKYTNILNKLFAAYEKDNKIQEHRLYLVEKDFVVSRLFSFLELLSNQLFDLPSSQVDNWIALSLTEKDQARIKIIDNFKIEVGRLIKDCKFSITKELENLKSKYEKKNDA